jgi:hypothetical protein
MFADIDDAGRRAQYGVICVPVKYLANKSQIVRRRHVERNAVECDDGVAIFESDIPAVLVDLSQTRHQRGRNVRGLPCGNAGEFRPVEEVDVIIAGVRKPMRPAVICDPQLRLAGDVYAKFRVARDFVEMESEVKRAALVERNLAEAQFAPCPDGIADIRSNVR